MPRLHIYKLIVLNMVYNREKASAYRI